MNRILYQCWMHLNFLIISPHKPNVQDCSFTKTTYLSKHVKQGNIQYISFQLSKCIHIIPLTMSCQTK